MANHTSVGKSNNHKMSTVMASESLYNRYVSECLTKGYIKGVGKGQQKTLFNLTSGASYVNHNATIVTDSAKSTAKTVGVITAGLPHSPIKEQSNASKRARELPFLSDTVEELCHHEYGCDNPQAYLLTLTIQNAPMGALAYTKKLMSQNLKKITDALYDGGRNKGTFQLHNEAGKLVKYLGCLVSTEITMNKDALKNESHKNLFHIHFHIVIIFSDEVDMTPITFTRDDVPNIKSSGDAWTMSKTGYQFFSRWCSLFPNYSFSPNAFNFKQASAKGGSGFDVNQLKKGKHKQSKPFAFSDALTEANKYATKPEVWNMLANQKKEPSDYLLKVFAELFNTLKGKDLHVPHKVVRDARSFLVFCRDAKILNAILAGYYSDKGQSDYVPDIFTQLNRFDGSKYQDGIKMNADQINYFNASLIEGGGFDASVLDDVTFPNTKKGKRFEYLLNQLRFSSLGLDGAKERYNHWLSALGRKAEGLRLARDNFISNHDVSENGYHDRLTKIMQQLTYFEQKIGDVKSLMASVTAGCRDDYVLKHYNYNERAEFLNIINTMRAMEQADRTFDWRKLSDDEASPEEIQLARLFGGVVSQGYYSDSLSMDGTSREAESMASWFVDDEIVEIYEQCKPFNDAELFNLVWSMTADDANDWAEITTFFNTASFDEQMNLMNQYGDARQQLTYAENKLAVWNFAKAEIDSLDSKSRIGLNTSVTSTQLQNIVNEKCISASDIRHGLVAPSLTA